MSPKQRTALTVFGSTLFLASCFSHEWAPLPQEGTEPPVVCNAHDDCLTGGVCDRTQAHRDGTGRCIDPKNVREVPAGASLREAFFDVIENEPTVTHLALLGPEYAHLRIDLGSDSPSYDVTIVGKLSVKTRIGHADGRLPGIRVDNRSSGPEPEDREVPPPTRLALQNVSLSGGREEPLDTDFLRAIGHYGLICHPQLSQITSVDRYPRVIVVESALEDNWARGAFIRDCHFELRRSVVRDNFLGGMLISANGSDIGLVNVLVENNGPHLIPERTDSAVRVGGIQISQDRTGALPDSDERVSADVTLAFLTVRSNTAQRDTSTLIEGIECGAGIDATLRHSIVEGHFERAAACPSEASNVTMAAEFDPDRCLHNHGSLAPGNDCSCANTLAATPLPTVLDIESRLRHASLPDCGAVEVENSAGREESP